MEHTSLSDALVSLIPTYGPWIIFGIVALESAGVPLPGEAILVAAALLAATTGQISIVVVALLRDMGVSVVQSLDAGAPGKRKTLRSGVPGRPTSNTSFWRKLAADSMRATIHPNCLCFRGNLPTHSATRSQPRPQ